MTEKFRLHLLQSGLSQNTVQSYMWTVTHFIRRYGAFTLDNLLSYKGYLVEHYRPQTVNLRLQGVNRYLEFARKDRLKLRFVKIQQKNFLENVISDADYRFLKSSLRKDGNTDWYFVVWFMAATGARVGELLQFKVEHVRSGYLDIYTKGGKARRIYIPGRLVREALAWLEERGRDSGYLFLNRHGGRLTTRGVAVQLKSLARRYGLDPKVVYPHSFRHRFAKNFLERFSDIALLADLMGHESIETTRIYLRRTASEQRQIIDRVVDW